MKEHIVKVILGIFTIDKGKIKVLLLKNKKDPYKGYWILPENTLLEDSLEKNKNELIEYIGLPKIYTEQMKTYSGLQFDNDNVVAVSYIGLIDSVTYSLKSVKKEDVEIEWFDINSIPKTAYDHNIIIEELYKYFKTKIVNSNILNILFPSDFTLPEIQRIYEQVLNKKLDRRNFRKKLMNLGYIIDTGDINEGYTGRPAKLYRFNTEVEERNLF